MNKMKYQKKKHILTLNQNEWSSLSFSRPIKYQIAKKFLIYGYTVEQNKILNNLPHNKSYKEELPIPNLPIKDNFITEVLENKLQKNKETKKQESLKYNNITKHSNHSSKLYFGQGYVDMQNIENADTTSATQVTKPKLINKNRYKIKKEYVIPLRMPSSKKQFQNNKEKINKEYKMNSKVPPMTCQSIAVGMPLASFIENISIDNDQKQLYKIKMPINKYPLKQENNTFIKQNIETIQTIDAEDVLLTDEDIIKEKAKFIDMPIGKEKKVNINEVIISLPRSKNTIPPKYKSIKDVSIDSERQSKKDNIHQKHYEILSIPTSTNLNSEKNKSKDVVPIISKTASIINKKDEVKIKKDIITLDTHPIRNKEKTIKNDNLYLAQDTYLESKIDEKKHSLPITNNIFAIDEFIEENEDLFFNLDETKNKIPTITAVQTENEPTRKSLLSPHINVPLKAKERIFTKELSLVTQQVLEHDISDSDLLEKESFGERNLVTNNNNNTSIDYMPISSTPSISYSMEQIYFLKEIYSIKNLKKDNFKALEKMILNYFNTTSMVFLLWDRFNGTYHSILNFNLNNEFNDCLSFTENDCYLESNNHLLFWDLPKMLTEKVCHGRFSKAFLKKYNNICCIKIKNLSDSKSAFVMLLNDEKNELDKNFLEQKVKENKDSFLNFLEDCLIPLRRFREDTWYKKQQPEKTGVWTQEAIVAMRELSGLSVRNFHTMHIKIESVKNETISHKTFNYLYQTLSQNIESYETIFLYKTNHVYILLKETKPSLILQITDDFCSRNKIQFSFCHNEYPTKGYNFYFYLEPTLSKYKL